MTSTLRKSIKNKKMVASTPALFTSRATIPGSTYKTLTRSDSFSSLLRSTPGEDAANPLEKEIEKYEQEYSVYLLRAFQAKILIEDKKKREEEAKKCFVSLKKEYEALLDENVQLYEQIRVIETYEKSIVALRGELSRATEVARVLTENELDETFRKLSENLEIRSSKMRLIGLKRKDIEDAFSKNFLGSDSDLYGIIKKMEEYVISCNPLLPEIAEEIREIQSLRRENEELKKRCSELAGQLRTRSITSNYEKYFKMALEECKDIIHRRENGRAELSEGFLLQRSSDFGVPHSSSTPSN